MPALKHQKKLYCYFLLHLCHLGPSCHKPARVFSSRAEHNMAYTVENIPVVPLRFTGIKNKLSVKLDIYTTALLPVA